MLADEIIAAIGGREDQLMLGAMSALANKVRFAHRFELSPGVMISSHAARRAPVHSQIAALPFTKLPFSECWFEWAGLIEAPGIMHPQPGDGAPTPRRVGALVHCIDETLQRGIITFAWVHDDMGISICPLAVTFDWRTDPGPLPDMLWMGFRQKTDISAEIREIRGHAGAKYFKKDSDGDLANDLQRWGVAVEPTMMGYLAAIGANSDDPRGQVDKIMKAAQRDIEAEPLILRSAIMLLNARNLAHAEARPAPERLNKQRAKKGRAPLLDYTAITIKLSKTMMSRAGGDGSGGRADSRQHIVMGHFKVRATGVYWWSPFPRGNPARGVVAPRTRNVEL